MSARACAWCGKAVDLPQPGWTAGHPMYCSRHHIVASRDPNTVHVTALTEAGMALDTDMGRVPTWPWRALRDLAGPIGPGTVTYLAAFPGNGKTSFIAHCITHWLRSGLRVFHMPLEASPREFLTRLICLELGIDPDVALSLRLLEMARAGIPWAVATRQTLKERYDAVLADPGDYAGLVTEPAAALTAEQFVESCHAAAAMDCDLLVVDHVDHIAQSADGHRSEISVSMQVQHKALEWARRSERPVVLASQLNSKATGGDALAHYRPPRMEWLWMKGVKEQVATSVLGLFRPLSASISDEELRAVTRGLGSPDTLAAPNRMGIVAMKLRYGGASKDRQVQLHYQRGVIRDLMPDGGAA